MNKTLYISILLLTMPALSFSMMQQDLENEYASAITDDKRVQAEITAHKLRNNSEPISNELFERRIKSLQRLGKAKKDLIEANPSHFLLQ